MQSKTILAPITILGALAACGPRLGLGGAPVAAWRARALWLNEPVTLNQGGAARRGILRGIAESGALLLEDDDGAIVPLHHGDLLRAAT